MKMYAAAYGLIFALITSGAGLVLFALAEWQSGGMCLLAAALFSFAAIFGIPE